MKDSIEEHKSIQYWIKRGEHVATKIGKDSIGDVLKLSIELRAAYMLGKEDGAHEWNNCQRD